MEKEKFPKIEKLKCGFCEQEIICPNCGSQDIREIIYGLLNYKSIEDIKEFKEKYFSGGCCIDIDSPKYYCNNCKKKFGKSRGDDYSTIMPVLYEKIEKLIKEEEDLRIKVDLLEDIEKFLKEEIREAKKIIKKTNESSK